MAIETWPAALRAHGIPVQLHNGFPNNKPSGSLPSNIASFFWHHDATPAGPTPGGLSWMINSYNAREPCAQIWIDTAGVWHFVGAGRASHAGVVRGNLTNANSVGAETDHTVNETYPTVQLDSIRKGVAICAIQEGRNADFLTFHKIEASPFGRKQDPWFDGQSNNSGNWGAELGRERGIVQRYINEIKGGGELPPPDNTEDELSAAEVQTIISELHYGFDKIMEGKGGEPPDHNIRQVKEMIAELRNFVQGMYNTMVEPQFQGVGAHAYRDEVSWATDKVIVPQLDRIEATLNSLPKS